jgi:hypothetical protein
MPGLGLPVLQDEVEPIGLVGCFVSRHLNLISSSTLTTSPGEDWASTRVHACFQGIGIPLDEMD